MKNNFFEKFICLVVLCLPTYLIRFKIMGIPFTFLEILILLLFIFFLIKTRLKFSLGEHKYIIYSFLLISLIACIVSVNNIAALGILKAYLLEPILFFIVIINVKPRFSAVLKAFGWSAVFISLVALAQYFSGYGIPVPWNVRGAEFRLTSVYDYPNAVGLYLTPIIVLFISQIVIVRKNVYFSLLVIVFSLLAVLGAKTEGAILAIVVSLFFLGFFSKWKKIFMGGLVVGIALIFIVPAFREAVTFQDTSGDVRLALWQGTWNLIKDRPLFGAGLASFQEIYPQYKLAKHVEALLYPHNIFLDFWVELGLFGIIWLLWVQGKFFLNNWRAGKPRNIALMAMMLAILIYGLVDVTYFKNDLAVVFWIILGFGSGQKEKNLL